MKKHTRKKPKKSSKKAPKKSSHTIFRCPKDLKKILKDLTIYLGFLTSLISFAKLLIA